MLRHTLLALAFALFFAVSIQSVAAQQGCCSWHGGIDYCGSDGYYKCNDGTSSPTCTCSDSMCFRQIDSNTDAAMSITDMQIKYGSTAPCEIIPTLQKLNQISINDFISNLNNIKESLKQNCGMLCIEVECVIDSKKGLDKFYSDVYKLSCQSCPSNSTNSSGTCTCNEGYIWTNNVCVTYDQSCQSKYGLNSYGDKQYCYCSSGYEMNTTKTQCIKKTPIITIPVLPPQIQKKAMPKNATPVKTKVSSSASSLAGIVSCKLNSRKQCICPVGYLKSRNGTQCVRTGQ